MLLFVKLALRNLIRNRVRTTLNIFMIVCAFTAILIFRGFANYMMKSVEIGVTEGQTGHVQIASGAVWNDDFPEKKEDAFIARPAEIISNLSKIPGVLRVGGRANAQVLLQNGSQSVGGYAIGFDSAAEPNMEKNLTVTEGAGFSPGASFEILVGSGLFHNLKLKPGMNLTVLSQTLKGSMSSVDVEVRGAVKSGFTDIDNSTAYMPLKAVQKLLGTEGVERIAVLCDNSVPLADLLQLVQSTIKDKSTLVAKSWKESATLYRQLTEFYAVQNGLVEVILTCLVFFGMLNTVGMSIFERMGEIGTLRALGDRNESILIQLALEGLMLGLVGALIAVPVSWLIAVTFSRLELQILMPGASQTMPIHIEPVVVDFLIAGAIVSLTCLVACLWPARRAVRLSIVDALRANS